MNDFENEPSEGTTSSLLAQKSQLERVSIFEITRKYIMMMAL